MKINPKLKDPNWRLENLYWIIDKSGNKSKFKPNYIQSLLNKEKSKRKVVLKARQVGITTNELLKMTDYVLFNKNKTCCILAHEQDALEKLFRIPKRAYENLHPELKPEIDRGQGSRHAMHFPKNNSRIYTDLSVRGDSIHWLHISERAFIEDESRVLATLECVPLDGIVTMESTPKGLNNFYDLWNEENNYKKIFFPWYLEPKYKITNHELGHKDLTQDELNVIDYALKNYGIKLSLDQIEFRRYKQKELKGLFRQEYVETPYDCFLTSGDNPFQLDIIKRIYDNCPKPIKVVNGIRIYKEREPNEIYAIGGDVAEGVSGDRSAAHVFKVRTREQVASFHSNTIKPSEFADKLVEMAEMYPSKIKDSETYQSLIGPERNNHGHAVLLKLIETHNWSNIFRHDKHSDKWGWITDKVTRPLMIDSFIDGVENGTIKLNDRDTLGECLTLINNGGKIQAETGKHDDLFIAACISIQLCIEESALDIYSNDVGNLIKI